MFDFLKTGEEVTFPGLLDIKLIVVELNEMKGIAKCKYYDDNLRRFIKLTLPANSLVPCRKLVKKKTTPVTR
ncbi:hypothetical protein ACX0G9_01210 [Flavitalea flava]